MTGPQTVLVASGGAIEDRDHRRSGIRAARGLWRVVGEPQHDDDRILGIDAIELHHDDSLARGEGG